MIGLILLTGLVAKNAILVVDFANVQRRAGMPRSEAVIAAARVRLRPILMTTLAMIFGIAAAGVRVGRRRLITSTLLTLLVVPVVYTYLDDVMSVRG